MLQATVDVDGSGLVHIFFEKGRLATVHYTIESEQKHSKHSKVYKVDSLMFTVNAASLGLFALDVIEDASDTFLLVRIKTDSMASASFNLEGYQSFHIDPAQDQVLVYSKAGGAGNYRKV